MLGCTQKEAIQEAVSKVIKANKEAVSKVVNHINWIKRNGKGKHNN